MTIIIFILIVIVCVVLGLIVLIQNPKGGGLSGTLAGFNNQFMGVKQTTDVLEKATWLFVSILGLLCVVSVMFLSGSAGGTNNNSLQDINTSTVPTQQAPSNTQQQTQPNTLQLDSTNK